MLRRRLLLLLLQGLLLLRWGVETAGCSGYMDRWQLAVQLLLVKARGAGGPNAMPCLPSFPSFLWLLLLLLRVERRAPWPHRPGGHCVECGGSWR